MHKIILSVDCVKYPLTGIGRYTVELSRQLEMSDNIDDLRYLRGLNVSHTLPVPGEQTGYSGYGIKKHLRNSTLVSEIYRRTIPIAKSFVIKKYINHIFHSPNYYLPPGVNNCIATFHDLSIFHWPEFHPRARVHLMQKELISAEKRAKILITDSEYTKKELVDFFQRPPESIVVAPLASSNDFMVKSESDIILRLRKYKLEYKKFILFTGTIEPRKNLITLLKVYERLTNSEKSNFPLVISGYKGWGNSEILRLFDKGHREGWLKYLGYVPSEELPYLFSGAKAFVFPSIYEGFGIPVLEAMASGTPVICSDSSSLPEVVGNAALIADPMDIDTFTSNLQIVLNDKYKEENLIARGLKQSSEFTWRKCASKTIEAYDQVLKIT
ncbi:glycosyltransferase family 4 protein [Rahnella sp. PD12R]|uniref:glycosyltransferase family 4 protein n=1 Tax=Rahnella sp. PD12R TaxID=2855688 RepID=UPI001C46C14D|nr:glycosyltransferase family 1 protein [Rahnella sp. PD12R]MBV6820337.1 glycosyltransferase family 4 protein [Rahnella sp. PD12R]